MMKIFLLHALLGLASVASLHAAAPAVLPPLSGRDLNGKVWTLPNGLTASRTLIFVAFEREQQAGIDSWTNGLGIRAATRELPWIEMPVIDNPGALGRWFIDHGMRGGIPDRATRGHVWTAYTDRDAFVHACALTGTNTVHTLVIDRKGVILDAESGGYTKAAGERILRAMGQ
jgi:hypothetical protein